MDTQLVLILVCLAVVAVSSLFQLATGKKTAGQIGKEVADGLRGPQRQSPSHLQAKKRLDAQAPFGQRVLQNLGSADRTMVAMLVGPGGHRRFVHGLEEGEPDAWLATVKLSPEERIAVLGGDGDPTRHEPTGLMELLRDQHNIDIGGYSEDELKTVGLHMTMKNHFGSGQ